MNARFSVVLSTYSGEQAAHLERCLSSLVDQSVPPDEIVVVLDGPVPDDQLAVLSEFERLHKGLLKTVQNEHNLGRGKARNVGVDHASHDWVAIMDSDDVCYPNRFELQLDRLASSAADIVVGWQSEFENDDEQNIVAIKRCPTDPDELKRSLKFRCLIPNPSIMFRRDLFLQAGGYGDYRKINEDHELFIRLAMAGARFEVIEQVLINVRIDPDQRSRRGVSVLMDDYRFRIGLYRSNYYNMAELVWYGLLITGFRLLPSALKTLLYRALRSDAQTTAV